MALKQGTSFDVAQSPHSDDYYSFAKSLVFFAI